MNNEERKIFRTKKGLLTRYAFSCGYLETFNNENIEIKIWMENGCPDPYHVRAFNPRNKISYGWECFDKVGDARKYFNQLKRESNLINTNQMETFEDKLAKDN